MNVLSLFDGISCGQLALQRVGIEYDNYFASEIKKSAIKITQKHFPDTVQLGDIRKITGDNLPQIDLIFAGTPCQDFSSLNPNGKGLSGSKSSLFYEFLRLLKKLKPKYFLMENIKVKRKDYDEINKLLNISGFYINSNLVSFQNRRRYYWTNITKIFQPKNRFINFQDFKEQNSEKLKFHKVKKTRSNMKVYYEKKTPNITNRKKINCITTQRGGYSNAGLIDYEDFCRYLTIEELEQGQTMPIGYTLGLSVLKRVDVIGDGWTIDIIGEILKRGDFY